mgnify:CR=1 FL=1
MKKLFVMLLALIMCLNLAACGSANTEKNSAEAATTQNANVIKEGEGAANSNDLAAVDSGYVMDTINIAQASLTSLDPMESSVFHGMDGRILPGAFFLQAKITGFHNGIPDFHWVQRFLYIIDGF